MFKLHLFSGFENKRLGITVDTELGHLYDTRNEVAFLIIQGGKLGLRADWIQIDELGFVHFDLWGKPLEKAKQLYPVAADSELGEDLKQIYKKLKGD